MRFEHLIEINAPQPELAAVVPVFTREQLWRGLMIRVRAPERFPNGPSRVDCTEQGDGAWHRVLHFGSHVFHDQVHIATGERVEFRPQAQGEATPIGLTITIEEPQPAQMVLRFVYESLGELTAEEDLYSGYRHSAWLHHDRDMVQTLRQWLDEGELGSSAH